MSGYTMIYLISLEILTGLQKELLKGKFYDKVHTFLYEP